MIFDRWYTWKTESGERWRFKVTRREDEIPDAAGVYIMAKRRGFFFRKPLYIGKASNLQSRLQGHEDWPEARRRGACERHYLAVRSETKRQRIEEDLIRKHHPALNVIHVPKDADDAPNNAILKRRWMSARDYWSLNDKRRKSVAQTTSAKDYWGN
ncbi:MAG: GIY-YIG nuclease family protein [Pseudomonadota bacterium]